MVAPVSKLMNPVDLIKTSDSEYDVRSMPWIEMLEASRLPSCKTPVVVTICSSELLTCPEPPNDAIEAELLSKMTSALEADSRNPLLHGNVAVLEADLRVG